VSRSALIIGAGPAGSVAAIVLARRGWDVNLVEQHRFPRDKVCGECLSALAIEVLNRLRITIPTPTQLTRATIASMDGREATLDLPREMWGLSRAVLDPALLDAARDAGAKILQPYRCERIDGLFVRLRDLQFNVTEERTADVILIADGKAPSHTEDLGVKAHFENVHALADTIGLFGLRGHYVGLAPIEGGRWNLAMSVPAKIVRQYAGNLDQLFASVLAQNAALRSRLSAATRIGDWLASPLPRFPVSSKWPAGTIPLGNAAAALEPIGGEGMGLAMRSAELAAVSLDENLPLRRLRRDYRRLWNVRRFGCRAAGLALSSPSIGKLMVRTIAGHKSLARFAMSLMKRDAALVGRTYLAVSAGFSLAGPPAGAGATPCSRS
jgi:flavin-dependent dehydrogenase